MYSHEMLTEANDFSQRADEAMILNEYLHLYGIRF